MSIVIWIYKMKLSFPTEISEGLFGSDIETSDNKPFVVQSSRVKWKGGQKIYLTNDHGNKKVEDFYDNLREVEENVCKYISENSEKWFGVDLDIEQINHYIQDN